eukprot:1897331-Pyramimonas_sp.AAC.1
MLKLQAAVSCTPGNMGNQRQLQRCRQATDAGTRRTTVDRGARGAAQLRQRPGDGMLEGSTALARMVT